MSKHISKSNDFINGSKPGTIWQMRVLHAAMMQIKYYSALNHNEVFSVTSDQLATVTGVRPTPDDMKAATIDLASMVISIQNDPNRKTDNAGGRVQYVHVVSECSHIQDEDRIDLRFSAAIIPLISQLHSRFTRLDVRHVMKMRSAFGIRLYELCMRRGGLGDYNLAYGLEDFRSKMGLTNGKYQAFGDLNARVLRPALDDINTYSDMDISCIKVKDGKKVTGLSFRIVHQE